MRPASARLLGIVSGGAFRSKSRVRLVTGFPQSVDPEGGIELTVLDGDVKMDSSSTVRATADVTVVAPWGSILPDGRELYIEYGVEVAGRTYEWVGLGYFRIDDVEQDTLNGGLRLSCSDRMAQVVDTKAVWPWVMPAGTSHLDFFSALMFGQDPADPTWFHGYAGVFSTYPDKPADTEIVFDYDAAGTTISYQLALDKPFDELMRKVAGDSDKRLFFDYKGRLNVVDDAVAAGAGSVLTVAAGDGGTLLGMRRHVTRDGTYSAFHTEGSEATEGDPPWGYALIGDTVSGDGVIDFTDGLSWFGPFGRIVKEFSSPLLTTYEACEAAANTLKAKQLGMPYSLSFDMAPNPALEPLDPITVRFPGPGPSVEPPAPGMRIDPTEEAHVVDSLTIPLTGGGMTVTTRAGVATPVDLVAPTPSPTAPPPVTPTPTPPPRTGPVSPVPATAPLIFSADFSATPALSGWGTVQNKNYNGNAAGADLTAYPLTIVNGGADHETTARFEVRSGDVAVSGERSEIRFPTICNVSSGQTRWIEFDLKFEAGFEGVGTSDWMICMQLHPIDSVGGSPQWDLTVREDETLRLRLHETAYTTIAPIDAGAWHRYTVKSTFATTGGAHEVWLDGVKVASTTGTALAAGSSSGNYFKLGVYRDAEAFTSILYYDRIRMWQG